MKQGIALFAVATLAGSLAAAPPGPAAGVSAGQDDVQLLRYVRAGADGAKLRNEFDNKGVLLLDAEPGQVLAVYEELPVKDSAGASFSWLSVEVPGGFPVWVFGNYLRTTAEPDVYEVTGNGVNQRPRPSSDPSSLPVRQKLFVRDRVTAIGRNDPSKPLEEDWVQIWAPAGVRAWVDSRQTEALPADVSGPGLWAQAALAVRERRTGSNARAGAAAGDAAPADAAAPRGEDASSGRALSAADELLAQVNQNASPDYTGVRAAYEAILAAAPEGATAELVRGRLREVEARALEAQVRRELEAQADAMRNDIEGQKRALEDAGTDRDPLANRFARRGWLERIDRGRDEPIWILRWSGEIVAEVRCTSGRYDLNVFQDYELGISGSFVPTAGSVDASVPPHVVVIDLTRIEVLSGRGVRR